MSRYRAIGPSLGIAICWFAGCRAQDTPRPVIAPAKGEDATNPAAHGGSDPEPHVTAAPTIQTAIHRVPAPEIARGAPEIVIAPPTGPATITELFRTASPLETRAGQPFRVLFQAGAANSPDHIAVRSARIDDHRIAVDIEHRAFEGVLGGNIQSTVIVELSLGPAQPASYELAVAIHRMGFPRIDDPTSAVPRDTSLKTWTFDVRP